MTGLDGREIVPVPFSEIVGRNREISSEYYELGSNASALKGNQMPEHDIEIKPAELAHLCGDWKTGREDILYPGARE